MEALSRGQIYSRCQSPIQGSNSEFKQNLALEALADEEYRELVHASTSIEVGPINITVIKIP